MDTAWDNKSLLIVHQLISDSMGFSSWMISLFAHPSSIFFSFLKTDGF
jgi:hypothetical protein